MAIMNLARREALARPAFCVHRPIDKVKRVAHSAPLRSTGRRVDGIYGRIDEVPLQQPEDGRGRQQHGLRTSGGRTITVPFMK